MAPPWDESLFGLVAYSIGVLLAGVPIHFIVEKSWRIVEAEAILDKPVYARSTHDALKRYHWQGDLVGFVERILYVTALLLNRPEFIAVWLTLKTVARSRRWTEESAVRGRAIFNNFLIGNGLSIFFAAAGYGIAMWLMGPSWTRSQESATIAALGLLTGSAIAFLWLSRLFNRKKRATGSLLDADTFIHVWGEPFEPR